MQENTTSQLTRAMQKPENQGAVSAVTLRIILKKEIAHKQAALAAAEKVLAAYKAGERTTLTSVECAECGGQISAVYAMGHEGLCHKCGDE